MRVVYTDQSIDSLEETLDFLVKQQGLSIEHASRIKSRLFDCADSLGLNPLKGQKEEYLLSLNQEHRRIIEGHFKIVYKVLNEVVYIVDFFDSRQDPSKMKG